VQPNPLLRLTKSILVLIKLSNGTTHPYLNLIAEELQKEQCKHFGDMHDSELKSPNPPDCPSVEIKTIL
jgi:hypothetical protein